MAVVIAGATVASLLLVAVFIKTNHGLIAAILIATFWAGLLAGLLAPIIQSRPYWALVTPPSPSETLKVPRVAHAGGSVDGLTYTNSIEALNRNKDRFILFEIDLMQLADGSIICLHDLGPSAEMHFGKAVGEITSLDEFLELRQFNPILTPCTLDELADWFEQNPEKFLVTDAKTDNLALLSSISSRHPALTAQTIPQIYYFEEFESVRELGFENQIFTSYISRPSAEEILTAVEAFRFFAITLSADEVGDLTQDLSSRGVPSYVHTVNDLIWFSKLREWGVSNIYTDHLKATLNGY